MECESIKEMIVALPNRAVGSFYFAHDVYYMISCYTTGHDKEQACPEKDTPGILAMPCLPDGMRST